MVIDNKAFYDLYGNVAEWVWDVYQEKLQGGKDPQGPVSVSNSLRVTRGGSWFNSNVQDFQSADRFRDSPYHDGSTLGFRLARTVP